MAHGQRRCGAHAALYEEHSAGARRVPRASGPDESQPQNIQRAAGQNFLSHAARVERWRRRGAVHDGGFPGVVYLETARLENVNTCREHVSNYTA